MFENKNSESLDSLNRANRLVTGVLKAAVFLVVVLILLRWLFEISFPELVRWLKPSVGTIFLIWIMVFLGKKKNRNGS